MSFLIDAIQLPRFPDKIDYEPQADVKTYTNPGKRFLIISRGKKADILVIQGKLQLAGNTKTNLTSTYITPLEAKMATEVTITNAGRSYSGEKFIFVKFKHSENPGWARAFEFRMEFWRGDLHVVITP